MTGYANLQSLRLLSPDALTVASNAVTASYQSLYTIAASAGSTDTLNTITPLFDDLSVNGNNYWPVILVRAYTGHTITLAHGVDNLDLPGDADYDLTDDRWIPLLYDSSNAFWQIIVIGDVTP
jgi:hypothetical protein